MSENIRFKITGTLELLQNNPQVVDPFNHYAIKKKRLTNKRTKTEDDLLEIRRLEVESKCYFDEGGLGVYVPMTWVIAALAGASYSRAKISKAALRGYVIPAVDKVKLMYDGEDGVKTLKDISGNERFVHTMLLKQQQVRIAKCAPIFNNWSFIASLNFEPGFIDRATLVDLLTYVAEFSGFGDFRPTKGRGKFEELKG